MRIYALAVLDVIDRLRWLWSTIAAVVAWWIFADLVLARLPDVAQFFILGALYGSLIVAYIAHTKVQKVRRAHRAELFLITLELRRIADGSRDTLDRIRAEAEDFDAVQRR